MTRSALPTLHRRASEAIQAMLAQVSGIRIRNIEHEAHSPDHPADLRVHVDIYGHNHTLVCKVSTARQNSQLLAAIEQLRAHAASSAGPATPLLIMPGLSPQAQDLCRACDIGYLDLEGNVRLVMDELFIVRRSRPCFASRLSFAPAQAPDSGLPRGFRPRHAEAAAAPHRMAS
jgi:hypothetical protein